MRNIQCELFNYTKIFSPIYHLRFNSDLKQHARFFFNLFICARYFFSGLLYTSIVPQIQNFR